MCHEEQHGEPRVTVLQAAALPPLLAGQPERSEPHRLVTASGGSAPAGAVGGTAQVDMERPAQRHALGWRCPTTQSDPRHLS